MTRWNHPIHVIGARGRDGTQCLSAGRLRSGGTRFGFFAFLESSMARSTVGRRFPTASAELYQGIVNLRDDNGRRFKSTGPKPVSVSMGGIATSGGYYIAVAGKPIYAERCASCHGDDLKGNDIIPGLTGEMFMGNWNGPCLDWCFITLSTTWHTGGSLIFSPSSAINDNL